jgi:hypothetical protein
VCHDWCQIIGAARLEVPFVTFSDTVKYGLRPPARAALAKLAGIAIRSSWVEGGGSRVTGAASEVIRSIKHFRKIDWITLPAPLDRIDLIAIVRPRLVAAHRRIQGPRSKVTTESSVGRDLTSSRHNCGESCARSRIWRCSEVKKRPKMECGRQDVLDADQHRFPWQKPHCCPGPSFPYGY